MGQPTKLASFSFGKANLINNFTIVNYNSRVVILAIF